MLPNTDLEAARVLAERIRASIGEHPLLVELAQRTRVRIVGVNYKDPPPGGLRFLGRYGNPYAAVGTDPAGRGAIGPC